MTGETADPLNVWARPLTLRVAAGAVTVSVPFTNEKEYFEELRLPVLGVIG